jgi:hypothetical protein
VTLPYHVSHETPIRTSVEATNHASNETPNFALYEAPYDTLGHGSDEPSESETVVSNPLTATHANPGMLSPSVIASFAVTALLVAGILWIQSYDPTELNWPTIKSIALGQDIEPAIPEAELPYVTGMPLVPLDRTEIATRRSREMKPEQRVTMSDIRSIDASNSESTAESQRR